MANLVLSGWTNFYEIVGSAGAALIGMQFVVMTLIASMGKGATFDTINTFGTPTVVHLACVLLVSAVMAAPWPSLLPVSVALGGCGLAGVGYGVLVIRRALRQTNYKATWDDWLWYVIVPWLVYATLAVASCFLCILTNLVLFVIGGVALGLLLIAIHNAWDSVTHIVLAHSALSND